MADKIANELRAKLRDEWLRKATSSFTCQECGIQANFIDEIENALDAKDKQIAEMEAERRWSPTHRHVKRGHLYQLYGYAEVQTDTPLTDYAKVAIYYGEDGTAWVRPVSEFHDGRFADLPAPEGEANG